MARRRKQTKDTFPGDLLYTQGRVWVRPGPGDTARLGLNVPAISESLPNIYHVDLRPRGYLVEGTPFAAADLDTALLELIAPFSARIKRVNWDAVQDPLLVMTSPFEEGWLYDLTRVKPEALRGLLDRDAFWSFLEFERLARRLGLKPVMGASYRLDAGAPWPDELRVTFGGLPVLGGRILRFGRNPTFTPQWSPGESWKVEVEFEQPSSAREPDELAGKVMVKVVWQYEVIDPNGSVDGEACYVVKAIEVDGPPPQSYYRLSITHEDFALRLIEKVSVFDANRRTLQPNDWGKETYMEVREPREIILDLPLFPPENRDEERKVAVGGEPELEQRAEFPDEKTMRLRCAARFGAEEMVSEQTWERGLPWWREARRLLGERVTMTGKLVLEEAGAAKAGGAK